MFLVDTSTLSHQTTWNSVFKMKAHCEFHVRLTFYVNLQSASVVFGTDMDSNGMVDGKCWMLKCEVEMLQNITRLLDYRDTFQLNHCYILKFFIGLI